ncbi:hypothetical protein ACIBBB_32435 [Streptomyces sp. NPDC051217]|uniref:hypothetical protein n=1 Tax=Streptomyces sp. NPDC051217 TaxID=3365644 RepID=UPI0037991496
MTASYGTINTRPDGNVLSATFHAPPINLIGPRRSFRKVRDGRFYEMNYLIDAQAVQQQLGAWHTGTVTRRRLGQLVAPVTAPHRGPAPEGPL